MSNTTTDNNWLGNLADTGIKTDLNNLAGNGSLNYLAALQLLNDVGADGTVTAAEFGDLQTIAAHLNAGLSASSYVSSIFDQLVLGSPANANWNGGTSFAAPLGNLHAGSNATQLSELIGKWFLGTDLPDPMPDQRGTSYTPQPAYRGYTLPLYGQTGAAAIADIAQGADGDCVVCSGLIQMVENHAGLLSSMIVDNGNGSYGVRFYINGNEDWVTVNNQLPASFRGITYAATGQPDDPAMWSALVEKAYAQLSSTGLLNHPPVNSYSNISADTAGTVLPNLNNADGVIYYLSGTSSWNDNKAAIIAAIANHQDVSVETATDATTLYDGNGQETLIPDHSHAVIGYDDATGNFIVRNPWGQVKDQQWVTEFEVSMDTIAAQGGDFAVATPLKQSIDVGRGDHFVGEGASVAVSQLFSVYNPDGLRVSTYSLQLHGSGTLQLNGAHNLATPQQAAQGQLVVTADDLAKVFYTAPTELTGTANLNVSALLGSSWSPPGDIALDYYASGSTSAAPGLAVLAKPHNLVAAGGSISLAALFTVSGDSTQAIRYTVHIPDDSGTLDLHDVKNYSAASDVADGYYQFAAADLARVTYSLAPGTQAATLFVTAFNGSGWSSFSDVDLHTGSAVVAAKQAYANGQFALAAHVMDSAANVFGQLDWIQAALDDDCMKDVVITDSGASTLSLGGAQLHADRGALALLDGNYALSVSGLSVADAVSLPDNVLSHLKSASVSGQAAEIAANLDSLQALVAAGQVSAIQLSDSGTPHLSLTTAQLASDGALLQTLQGPYRLTVSGSAAVIAAGPDQLPAARQIDFAVRDSSAHVIEQLDALQALAAAGKLSSIVLTDSGTPALLLTPDQLSNDADALSKLSGGYRLGSSVPMSVQDALHFSSATLNTVVVADSADQVAGRLDSLQQLYASGKLSALTLTDSDAPALLLSATQLVTDAPLLHAIGSPYTVSVTGVSTGVAQFLIEQNAAGHRVGTGSTTPAGGNSAIGFQTANFSGGYNAVVLDDERSHYTLQVDASGKLQIQDIVATDATYGQSVTVKGASYVIFDAAATDSNGNYPAMYFIANSQNAAVAELYVAAFGRQPDLAGLEYWQGLANKGLTLQSIAADFIGSGEFAARFAAASTPADHGGASDQAFVQTVYENVLQRAPDRAGMDYWVSTLANGGARADLLASFAISAENVANTNATAGHASGWLIDTGKGGYADSGTVQHMAAAEPAPLAMLVGVASPAEAAPG